MVAAAALRSLLEATAGGERREIFGLVHVCVRADVFLCGCVRFLVVGGGSFA